MVIKIIAIAQKDGWAFISKDGKIFLVKPPYDMDDKIEVPIDVVAEGINSYEFEEFSASFEKEDDLIQFVKDVYINSKEKNLIPSPSLDQLVELLDYSTDEILLNFLRRIENEMVNNGKYLEANNMINMLLKIKCIEQRAGVYQEILRLKNIQSIKLENKKNQ